MTEELDPEAQRAHAAEVAAVNAELAEWADEPANQWMIPPELLESRRAASALRESIRLRRRDRRDRGQDRRSRRGGHQEVAAGRGTPPPSRDPSAGRVAAESGAARTCRCRRQARRGRARDRRADAELDATEAASRFHASADPRRPALDAAADDARHHWPFVFLVMYGTDLVLLLLIGKVPLAYNFRYLWVRRRDTLLTALAFTVVVALVVILLAFVNGMYKLNESTGVPGNVLVMSEGSTDELFSNLERSGSGGVDNVMTQDSELRSTGRPIGPVGIARGVIGPDGRVTRLPAERAARTIPARSTWRVSSRTS